MNEAQVWAVIAVLGTAVLLLMAERLVARLVKLWVAEAALRTLRPLFKALVADERTTSRSETPHVEVPKVTSWGPHGRGCRCGIIQA